MGILKHCSLIIDLKLEGFLRQYFSSGQETSSDCFKATKLGCTQEDSGLFSLS